MYMARDVLDGPYDGKVDVFSTGIMAAELVVRHMDIAGFERAAPTQYNLPEHRPALVADACTRLDGVCAPLSAVVRGCSAVKAKHRMTSEAALRALQEIDIGDRGMTATSMASTTAPRSGATSAVSRRGITARARCCWCCSRSRPTFA
jgi:hypothetical protein